jgi:hypothetical protein
MYLFVKIKRKTEMTCNCSYQLELMKSISGAHTLLHAGPESYGAHTLRVSPPSIDVKDRDRQI